MCGFFLLYCWCWYVKIIFITACIVAFYMHKMYRSIKRVVLPVAIFKLYLYRRDLCKFF
uniref:Ovule protein n=1 Tax=Heterorhabditis bacteriophora TaxID=37862 RepID=A0A1I7W828_HETBA